MKTKYIFSIMLIVMMALSTPALADDLADIGALIVSLTNQDPDPAIAGNIAEVRIGIENKGGTIAENIVLELVPQYPFELALGETSVRNIGAIRGYQDGDDIKIVKYKIKTDKDAIAGSYELKLWKYKEGQKDLAKTEVILSIDIKNKESAEIIYIDKVELLPGKQTAMTFTINNVGSAPLRNLKFSWENEDEVILPVGSDDTRHIRYLDIDERTELSSNVIASANAEPDLYKLTLSLTYDDSVSGEETNILTSAGVYVGGETDFDITFSGSSMGETS
ncbi:MAG: COG1361 S-layer family protein, partial [Candidatus Aenigmarchaeota archaeon]|nr:COG1361 S-layer family protein [Candidatus Aenigmarchaeota archaeon]